MQVKDKKVTMTLKFEVATPAEDISNIGKAIKAEAEKVMKTISVQKLTSGYKEAK